MPSCTRLVAVNGMICASPAGASCRGRDGTGRSGRGTEVRNVVAFGTSGVMEMVARWVGARARGGPADDGGGVARRRGAGEGAVGGGSGGRGPRGRVGRAAHLPGGVESADEGAEAEPGRGRGGELGHAAVRHGYDRARKRCHRSGRVSSRGGTRARVDARTRRTRDRRCSVRQHSRRCRRSVFATPLEVRARGSVCEAATPAVPHQIELARRAIRSRVKNLPPGPGPFETARRSTAQGQILRSSFEFDTHVRVGSAVAIMPRNAHGFLPPAARGPHPRRPPCPRSGGRARG